MRRFYCVLLFMSCIGFAGALENHISYPDSTCEVTDRYLKYTSNKNCKYINNSWLISQDALDPKEILIHSGQSTIKALNIKAIDGFDVLEYKNDQIREIGVNELRINLSCLKSPSLSRLIYVISFEDRIATDQPTIAFSELTNEVDSCAISYNNESVKRNISFESYSITKYLNLFFFAIILFSVFYYICSKYFTVILKSMADARFVIFCVALYIGIELFLFYLQSIGGALSQIAIFIQAYANYRIIRLSNSSKYKLAVFTLLATIALLTDVISPTISKNISASIFYTIIFVFWRK